MADAGAGLLITSMFGPSLNGNTGDWSVGCSGFWFEDGEIGLSGQRDHRGRQPDRHLRAAWSPAPTWRSAAPSNAPSLLVDALAIAGK